MAKFETMDPKIVTEAIHASFNLNEYQTIPFEKERSGEIIREAMEGLGMKNLIPQSNIVLKELFDADLTSAEAVAYFLYSLTQRKRQNRSLMQLQMAHFPSNCTIESYDFSRVNEKIGRQIRELEKKRMDCSTQQCVFIRQSRHGKDASRYCLGEASHLQRI